MKTEDLLRYEAEFQSMRTAFRARVLVVKLAPDTGASEKDVILPPGPPDKPQACPARLYSDE